MKNGPIQVKISVLGARHVGKSALTVRYLTRRYIGEYKSYTDLSYRQIFTLDGNSVEVEIVDVSNQPEDTTVPTFRARNSDACIVVYSINDRSSFRAAHEILMALRNRHRYASSIPMLLLANKKDLEHLRQVESTEGRELARRYCCSFCEVSAAEAETEPELSLVFNQIIREAQSCKAPHDNNDAAQQQQHQQQQQQQQQRQRKRSVFIINRMFGSLIGRNSMPPELPPKNSSALMASSMPDVAGSLKSVFKKRSV